MRTLTPQHTNMNYGKKQGLVSNTRQGSFHKAFGEKKKSSLIHFEMIEEQCSRTASSGTLIQQLLRRFDSPASHPGASLKPRALPLTYTQGLRKFSHKGRTQLPCSDPPLLPVNGQDSKPYCWEVKDRERHFLNVDCYKKKKMMTLKTIQVNLESWKGRGFS